MKTKNTIVVLVAVIGVLAILATTTAIFSHEGPGPNYYISIRGKLVDLYGTGLYKDMSAEVAPQGLAQDHVTLLIALPILIFSLYRSLKGSLRARFIFTGTLLYFLVTYLFYLVMAMYNKMFLAYVGLAGASFFGFLITLRKFEPATLPLHFSQTTPVKACGGFLMFSAIAIGLLWLSIVVPPLTTGSIVPAQVEHYTTLVVQGLDLAILLPGAFIIGRLFTRKAPLGYLLAPVYLVFLSLLMTALSAKVIAMAERGYPVIPVVFIIPLFNLLAVIFSWITLKNVRTSVSRFTS